MLQGGAGDDTYIFNRGDGHDTIYDYDRYRTNYSYYDAGNDTLQFGEGITKDDISFVMEDQTLLLQYSDEDLVAIKDQGLENNAIERIELSDGSYLSDADIDLVIQQINAYVQDQGIETVTNETIRNNEALMQIVMSAWKEQ